MASAWWGTNSQHLLAPCVCLSSFVGVPPTLSFAACRVCLSIQLSRSRASLKAERISLIMSSAWEIKWDSWWTGPNQTRIRFQTRNRSQITCPCCSNTLCSLRANNTNSQSLCCVCQRSLWQRGHPERSPECRQCFQCKSASGGCRTATNHNHLQPAGTIYNKVQLLYMYMESSAHVDKDYLSFQSQWEKVKNKQTNKNLVESSIKMITSS